MNKRLENVATVKRYTLINKKEKNKIDERDIYANASNCGAENTAITLIALIITIIVLLILAGVTLNMVMGDSGIFSKANQAKNKTEVAQYEEELRMCILELQTDTATNGTTFNMETIKNKLVEKVKELENTDDIEFPTEASETRLDGTYKGYEFYIDEKYVAHIGDKATGIQLTISLNPSGWTNQNVTATITIKSNNGIRKIVPQGESEITLNGEKEYTITKSDIAENTTFAYEVTDSQNNTQTKKAIINTIDKEPPQDFQIEAEVTEEGLKITANPQDKEATESNACSGISKVEYYLINEKNETKTYETNIIKELPSGTYSVYAKAYDKAGNEKQSANTVTNLKVSAVYKNITAKMVAEHPELYYGLTVTNYESQNGQNDWKIFYSDWKENPDNAHIFLITGDYVKVTDDKGNIDESKLNSNTKMLLYETSKSRVSWDSSNLPEFSIDIDDKILTRFKATKYNINNYKKNRSSKYASTLLNTQNWEKYKDINGKAEYAIGGPTIEMWIDSWNSLYKNIDGELFCNNTNEYGYYIGTNSMEKNLEISLSNRQGKNNYLYISKNTKDGNNYIKRYWLSSTTADDDYRTLNIDLTTIRFNSGVSDAGLRPVVSLNKDITIDAKDSE